MCQQSKPYEKGKKKIVEVACVYLHRMPCKLVHDDGVFGLIERTRDVLHE